MDKNSQGQFQDEPRPNVPRCASPHYVEVITERCVERFMRKLLLSSAQFQALVLVSPFMAPLERKRFNMDWLAEKIEGDRIPTYVITREPHDEFHRLCVEALMQCAHVEIRFNSSLHAKLYVAMSQDIRAAFALFGSANLTVGGYERNIELGMMVYGHGRGREIIEELYRWGTTRLRTDSGSKLIKRRNPIRRT